MSFLTRLLGLETRAAPVAASDPFLAQFFAARGTYGSVTPETVLSAIPVAFRCVQLIAEMTASLRLPIYRRSADNGRELATDLPLYHLLNSNFSERQSAYEAREFLARSILMTGNAYARIERDYSGAVVAIYPLWPIAVGVERLPGGRLRYRVTDPWDGSYVLLQEEILHLRYASVNGFIGMSPIAINAASLGLALSQAETAQSLMQNGARPSGLISYAEKLGPEAMERARARLENTHAGADNAGKTLLMDGGAKFQPFTFAPEDMEFLNSRKLANLDVARIFGVPPTVVGIVDHATFSNSEQEAVSLVRNCIGPFAARLEAAFQRCLLTPDERRTLYIEHDLSTLLRGDTQARFEAYRVGREIGALSANDVRRLENQSPIPGGDTYQMPANWVPLGSAPAQNPNLKGAA